MAFTEEEMKSRWRAGIQDLDGDGGVLVNDIVLAAKFASEAGLDQSEELKEIGSDILGKTTQSLEESSTLASAFGSASTSEETQIIGAKSDIQSNALPSLPSISNVGAVAPTGIINWNAIPGGFQPLPQVAGGKKKLYQLSKFHGGIHQKSSPRYISDKECQ